MQKSVLLSKTFYFGLATALVPLFPPIGEFLANNVEAVGMVWGAAAIVLRFLTKGGVVLKD